MNSSINETSGKTETVTSAVSEERKDLCVLVAKEIVKSGKSFKTTGGNFVSEADMTDFIETVFACSNLGRYDTVIAFGGTVYPISAYTIDGRLGEAFAAPKMVCMPGTSPFLKDVRVHEEAKVKMSPARFIEFQYQFFANFRQSPILQSINEFIKPTTISDVKEVSNGVNVHIDDISAIKALPLKLSIADNLFNEEYFTYPIAEVIKQVVINLFIDMKANHQS